MTAKQVVEHSLKKKQQKGTDSSISAILISLSGLLTPDIYGGQ
jgi:hypothetical protein